MSNEERAYGLIGLCKKAGRLAAGSFSVDKSIKSLAAYLVIIANDASDNTKKEFLDSCNYYGVKSLVFSDKEQLGHCCGYSDRVVVSVNDEGFANAILKLIDTDNIQE